MSIASKVYDAVDRPTDRPTDIAVVRFVPEVASVDQLVEHSCRRLGQTLQETSELGQCSQGALESSTATRISHVGSTGEAHPRRDGDGGHTGVKGQPATDEEIQAWAEEAEAGYDVEVLRMRGRNPLVMDPREWSLSASTTPCSTPSTNAPSAIASRGPN